jgi:hypothetical protein
MNILSVITTFLVFGYIGYELSKVYNRRINFMIVLAYAILTLLAYHIGAGTRLLSIFGFAVKMNQVLGSILGGLTVGIFVKLIKRKTKPETGK